MGEGWFQLMARGIKWGARKEFWGGAGDGARVRFQYAFSRQEVWYVGKADGFFFLGVHHACHDASCCSPPCFGGFLEVGDWVSCKDGIAKKAFYFWGEINHPGGVWIEENRW